MSGWQWTFWVAGGLFAYVYVGYPGTLAFLAAVFGRNDPGRAGPPASPGSGAAPGSAAVSGSVAGGPGDPDTLPHVTVIVAAYNEAGRIRGRIDNIRGCEYPPHKLEVLVASDGSDDDTVARCRAMDGVRCLDFPERRGRAMVHNDAVEAARGRVLVFTDAETLFEPDFLLRIAEPFVGEWSRDVGAEKAAGTSAGGPARGGTRAAATGPSVGCVVGNLSYRDARTATAVNEGAYFRYEKWIRRMESRLGLLFVGTGACLAVERRYWRPLKADDDVDFATPLDVLLAGGEVRYAPGARASDVAPSTTRGEFSSRVRITSRNLLGTVRRWGLRAWLKRPLVSWAVLSHKILRYLSPYLLLAFAGAAALTRDAGSVHRLGAVTLAAAAGLALLAWLAQRVGVRLPLGSFILSFAVVQAALFVGVLKMLAGAIPEVYDSPE